MPRWGWTVAVVGCLALLGTTWRRAASSGTQGVSSCAAGGCHQRLEASTSTKGDEYTAWITRDPHARAYEVLFEPRSQQMVRLLQWKPAHEEGRCLVCHVGPHWQESRKQRSLLDGVGCESCHGPADAWLADHHRKDAVGLKARKLMGDTKSILGRGSACLDCHVGAPGREVDHDLIAAGHPRLNFELASFFARYPRHWQPTEAEKTPEYEAALWFTGQALAAEASLKLLASREAFDFADQDCYACHHNLKSATWRLGSRPSLNAWYTGLVPEVLKAAGQQLSETAAKELESLRKSPRVGGSLQKELHDRAVTFSRSDGTSVKKWSAALRNVDRERFAANWDTAAQYFLGLAALGGDAGELRKLVDELQWPERFDPNKFLSIVK